MPHRVELASGRVLEAEAVVLATGGRPRPLDVEGATHPDLITLRTRADALLNDDYYESDKAWMDLDSRVEVTIGPYETYEDQLLGLKAAYESFVMEMVADHRRKLRRAAEAARNRPLRKLSRGPAWIRYQRKIRAAERDRARRSDGGV